MPTNIEWAQEVWNPITGCQKISPGCANCYAENYAIRFWNWKIKYIPKKNLKKPNPPHRLFKEIRSHPERLNIPAKWKKPKRIFLCSMGDLFNEKIPFEFINRVFSTMINNKQHSYLILTKRVDRMARYLLEEQPDHRKWKFIWFGTSVEDQDTANDRLNSLCYIDVLHRFVSIEPLIGRVNLSKWLNVWRGKGMYKLVNINGEKHKTVWMHSGVTNRIHWVIAGGETGPKARLTHQNWVKLIRDQCLGSKTPFFFKGWGNWMPVSACYHPEYNKKRSEHRYVWDNYTGECMARVGKAKAGYFLDGKIWKNIPAEIYNQNDLIRRKA